MADSHGDGAERGGAGSAAATGAGESAAAAAAQPRSVALGLTAVLAAASSSAFASVYFERILKGVGAQGALWKRNMELCTWTVPMNLLLAALQASREQPLTEPLRGFTASTWAVIVVNGAPAGGRGERAHDPTVNHPPTSRAPLSLIQRCGEG